MSTPKIFAVIAILMILAPAVALAYTTPSLWPTGYWAPQGLISCTGFPQSANLPGGSGNQPTCQSLCDLINTLINIIYFAMSIAIFILTPILFAVGGIMIMISGASPEMLSKGKKTLTGTLIGLIIVLCAYLLVYTAVNVLQIQQFVGGFGGPGCTATF